MKKQKLPPTEIVSLRLPRKLLRELDARAKRERVTRTALIVRALQSDPVVLAALSPLLSRGK